MTGNSTAGRDRSSNGSVEDHHRTKGLLRLTMACHERCAFCNVPVEQHSDEATPAAELDRTLRSFAESGQRTVTISGGEPTLLRRRLIETIAAARARGMAFVELQTNAVRIDQPYAEALRDAGLTSAFVPLLSHRPATHDALMGRAGALRDGLAGSDALAAAGVRITVNVVITEATQREVPEMVDFVADRLPMVRSVSLSSVQPHGRAAAEPQLLPDYAVLGDAVREALRRAKRHRIELLNPYCGLPLCVGWEQDQERCVEAIESAELRGAGFGDVPGVDNRGDKRHGPPCRGCAVRTRCGGAWHAYWAIRGSSGIAPPAERVEPWDRTAATAPEQTVVVHQGALTGAVLAALDEATTPTVWLDTDRLDDGDGHRLGRAGCSDLSLRLEPPRRIEDPTPSRELARIAERNRQVLPQAALRTLVELGPGGTFRERFRALEYAVRLGVEAVRVALRPAARRRFERFIEAAQRELPAADLALVEPEVRRR